MGLIIRLFISGCFLYSLPSFAGNDIFGGVGAVPIPAHPTEVTMLDEKITITGMDIDKPDLKGGWEYHCDYTFKSISSDYLSFQMGLPVLVNDELAETAVPDGYSLNRGDPLVYDLSVKVNGNVVKAMTHKITSPLSTFYKEAFLWKMNLDPHALVKIRQQYLTGITTNAQGQYFITFVLRTATLWKDPKVSSARFQIIPNVPTRLCTELNPKELFLTPKPPGIQTLGSGKDRKYVWDLRQFQSNDDLQLCLMTGRNYVRYFMVKPILNPGFNNLSYDLSKLTIPELETVKNTIYAQYGKRFNNPTSQTYFEKQWWYEKNPEYSDNLLTEEDHRVIAFVNQLQAPRSTQIPNQNPTQPQNIVPNQNINNPNQITAPPPTNHVSPQNTDYP